MYDSDIIRNLLKQIQDYLCPRLDAYEQMLYHHLFRHSHVEGSPECIIGIKSLRHKVGLGTGVPGSPPSEDQIRTKIRSLESKGCIRVLDRNREGTRLRVFLPQEIPGCVPTESPETKFDVETIDFSRSPYRKCIVLRENSKCFYCFRELKEGHYELDHVIPSAKNGDNTYRNLVAACLNCNNTKGDQKVEDFLRSLYRQNLLSQDELQGRLEAVSELQQGKRIPPIPESETFGG